MNERNHAGEYNRRVELYEFSTGPSTTGERVRTDNLLKQLWAKRIEVSGSEVAEGKVLSLSVLKFEVRYDQDLLINGTKYFIRDLDGDYRINSVGIKSRAEIELKCSKRG